MLKICMFVFVRMNVCKMLPSKQIIINFINLFLINKNYL